MNRIAKNELNIKLKLLPKFICICEHFYDDSILQDESTHYVNLAYEIEIEEIPSLSIEQHNEYRWFTIDELFKSEQVNKYVKDYFKD